VTAGNEACEKEGGAHGFAPPAIMALPFHWPGLAGERGKPARLAIRLPSSLTKTLKSRSSLQSAGSNLRPRSAAR
jgi:hypothetical protein